MAGRLVVPMRTTLLLLLAASLLVAGCTQTDQPATSGRLTTTSGQGIAPGEPAPGGHGGAAIRPPTGHNETSTLSLDGSADRSGFAQGGSSRFDFTAKNLAAAARTEGFCGSPYAFSLRDAKGQEHPLHTPQARCLAYSENPFPAGATYDFNMTWDGTYAEGDHMVAAPQGSYSLTATFTALRSAGPDVITLTLPVSILAMGQQ